MASQGVSKGQGFGGQPTSYPRHHRAPGYKIKVPHAKGAKQEISFYGVFAQTPTATPLKFDVLAGDTAPTITGGYAKYSIVDRPLRRGLSIFTGYDPPAMTLSVRFMELSDSGWDTSDAAGTRVEADIHLLEKMAGETFQSGPPCQVYVSTSTPGGDTTPLIPFWWQESNTANVPKQDRNSVLWPWWIQGLDWDSSPIRNASGYRVRQDATVTLLRFSELSDPPKSAAQRNKNNKDIKPRIFHTTAAVNTPLAIARALKAQDRVATANQIRALPANKKLHLRSNGQRIKPGTAVRVPTMV